MNLAWIDRAKVPNRHELPPVPNVPYVAGVDPSGGRGDSFTLSICHLERDENFQVDRVVQDVCRGWQRVGNDELDLEGVVSEIAGICNRYGCTSVVGDRYAASWTTQAFRRAGIAYLAPKTRTKSAETGKEVYTYADKSACYLEVEPLFATSRVEILDHPRLCRELSLLERRNRAGGKPLMQVFGNDR